MKLDLGTIGNNETVFINTEWAKTRDGFCHKAATILSDCSIVKAKVNYYNRTWETFPYQSVCHDLCEKIAMHLMGCPNERSFNKAGKWAKCREYAEELKKRVDEQGRA